MEKNSELKKLVLNCYYFNNKSRDFDFNIPLDEK